MLSFFSSLFLIFIAELGDKTQLLALSFATKYKPTKVLIGVFIGTLVVHLLSVVIGEKLTGFIPEHLLRTIVGLSFIGFGIWTIRGDSCDEKKQTGKKFGPVITVAVAFFLAELGDKTQLATISLAAQYRSFVGVWLGSSLGMVISDGIAIAVGVVAGKKIPANVIKYISATIFILFGALIISELLRNKVVAG